MCGRFTLTAPADIIADLFEVAALPPIAPHYNIAPTQDVLAVRADADGAREAVMLRWGLIPYWADDRSIGSRLVNARSETAAEKPAFRDAFERRRCLVVADGFFEWKPVNRHKQPYWIRLADGAVFGMAGLWERWRDEEGEWLQTCTVLTTGPNELVAPLHDRMPVIVPPAQHATWLDPDTGARDLQKLLCPFPAEEMTATAVSTRVNSVAHDDPGCVEPVQVQGSLL